MLSILLYIWRALRRSLDRLGHGMSIWVDAFREAMRLSAAAGRKYPYIE
jgi:hypothetical protein